MSRSTTFIGWVAGGLGVILITSAVKNKSPYDVVKGALSGNGLTARTLDKPNTSNGESSTNGGSGTNTNTLVGGSVGTAAAAAGGSNKSSDWVSIQSQPKFKLAPVAATSFNQVERDYGKTIYLSGAGRSYAEQVIGYNLDPNRFAKPGNSLHEWGLAVDIDMLRMNVNDPALVAAFSKNGWLRRGKQGDWDGNGTKEAEPWHWSKGVAG